MYACAMYFQEETLRKWNIPAGCHIPIPLMENFHMIVCDPRAMGDVMYYLSDVIERRLEAGENQKNRKKRKSPSSLCSIYQ